MRGFTFFGVLALCAAGTASCLSVGNPIPTEPLDGGGGDGTPLEPPPPMEIDPTEAVFTRYPADRVLSPFTPSVAARLREIASRDPDRADNVFLKAGASGTVSRNLLTCFAGDAQPQYRLDLDGRDALLPTIDFFRTGDAAGTTPFDRATLAAKSGRTAAWVIDGAPSPLDQEIAEINPRFAFVNYGTNDMGQAASYAAALPRFYESMSTLLDQLEDGGIVPVVSGLNPRSDSDLAARWVPTYDAVTRAMAEARQIPYLSLYLASHPLPAHGLVSDGIHGNVLIEGGSAQPCVFNTAGLERNYNVRNLWSITALDLARQLVVDGAVPPEAPPLQPVAGSGAPDDPFVVDRLPFSHAWDTRRGVAQVDQWSCGPQDESGPEVYYRLDLPAGTSLRAVVLDRGTVDTDVHVVRADGQCPARGDTVAESVTQAGDRVVVDSFASSGQSREGPFLLVLVPAI